MWSRSWTRIRNSRSRILPDTVLGSTIWRFFSTFTGKRFAAVWGNGDYGRLGHGNLQSHSRPMPVASPAFGREGLKSIACGGAHTLFLTGRFPFLHFLSFSLAHLIYYSRAKVCLKWCDNSFWVHVRHITWRWLMTWGWCKIFVGDGPAYSVFVGSI